MSSFAVALDSMILTLALTLALRRTLSFAVETLLRFPNPSPLDR